LPRIRIYFPSAALTQHEQLDNQKSACLVVHPKGLAEGAMITASAVAKKKSKSLQGCGEIAR
jgi:hypothetical protein